MISVTTSLQTLLTERQDVPRVTGLIERANGALDALIAQIKERYQTVFSMTPAKIKAWKSNLTDGREWRDITRNWGGVATKGMRYYFQRGNERYGGEYKPPLKVFLYHDVFIPLGLLEDCAVTMLWHESKPAERTRAKQLAKSTIEALLPAIEAVRPKLVEVLVHELTHAEDDEVFDIDKRSAPTNEYLTRNSFAPGTKGYEDAYFGQNHEYNAFFQGALSTAMSASAYDWTEFREVFMQAMSWRWKRIPEKNQRRMLTRLHGAWDTLQAKA